MHQLGVIYTQFYGGFIQGFQLANGVKRVNGDPVKGDFQAQDRFAMKLYKSCKRYMLRRFLQMDVMDEISTIQIENNGGKLQLLLVKYCNFRRCWIESVHKPSSMVGLFMKYMLKYTQCKNEVLAHDGWILEIESSDLLSA
jgi:hypothetical protein